MRMLGARLGLYIVFLSEYRQPLAFQGSRIIFGLQLGSRLEIDQMIRIGIREKISDISLGKTLDRLVWY